MQAQVILISITFLNLDQIDELQTQLTKGMCSLNNFKDMNAKIKRIEKNIETDNEYQNQQLQVMENLLTFRIWKRK